MAITHTKAPGRVMFLQVDTTGGGVYGNVGGSRAHTVTTSHEQVDITDKDDDRWRKLLEDAGVGSVSLQISGLLTDDSNFGILRDNAQGDVFANYRMLFGGGGANTLTGKFQVASFEITGEYNGAQEFSATLESADTPVFVNP